jgi:hypothetical protein
VDAGLDRNRAELVATAQDKLVQAARLVTEVRELFGNNVTEYDLPAFTPPEPADVPGLDNLLVSSEWDFAMQCRTLNKAKAYGGEEDE